MGPNGEAMETAAIVTTRANRTLSPIHERMPVVVPPEAFDFWLDCRKVDGETAAALITPAREDVLEAYEISPAVNHVANDSAELIVPVTAEAAAPATKPEEKRAASGKAKKANDQPSLF
jgi:putative SOS response-associated peptidase YedK